MDYRRIFFLFAVRVDWAGVMENMLCIASFCTLAICRFAVAVAWPRAVPIDRLAALSHMLIRGFFFVHGLLIEYSCRFETKHLICNMLLRSGDV
jgi:hypothetical protein